MVLALPLLLCPADARPAQTAAAPAAQSRPAESVPPRQEQEAHPPREPAAGGSAPPDLEETPREVELGAGAELRVDVWRGGLEIRSRHGGALRLDVGRETERGGACQRVAISRSADGGVDIRTGPQGGALCVERVTLRLGLPDGVRLRAVVSDGPITVERVSGTLDLVALRGSVQVRGGQGSLHVASNAGGIHVEDSAARMTLESVADRIEVSGAVRAPLAARSVSGSVVLRLRALDPVEVEAETLGGDIRVGYPPGVPLSLEIAPGAGSVEADFALPAEERDAHGDRWLRAVEAGRALLRLRTERGHISLSELREDQDPEGGAGGADAGAADSEKARRILGESSTGSGLQPGSSRRSTWKARRAAAASPSATWQ
jgi:hypothetical protein